MNILYARQHKPSFISEGFWLPTKTAGIQSQISTKLYAELKTSDQHFCNEVFTPKPFGGICTANI
jgi:hypothetical protein